MSSGRLIQVLQIQPNHELIFKGPFNAISASNITLTNPTTQTICFKVKTTAPKHYCVRPNSGVVSPGETKSVGVFLQPLDADGVAEGTRHKFMVQSCYAPGEVHDHEAMWKEVDPTSVMHTKLMVKLIDVEAPRQPDPEKLASADNETLLSMKNSELQQENSILATEIQELFRKNAKLQNDYDRLNMVEIGVPIVQMILAAIAALLIGLIIGRLF